VADFLRDCCAEGRLGADELDERLDRLFGGHTVADLDAVVWDLPGGEAVLPRLWPAVRTQASPPARRGRSHRGAVALLLVGIAVVLISSIPPEALVGLAVMAIVLGFICAVFATVLAPAGFVLIGIAWLAGRLWRGSRLRTPLR
jgi:hypothetical protein